MYATRIERKLNAATIAAFGGPSRANQRQLRIAGIMPPVETKPPHPAMHGFREFCQMLLMSKVLACGMSRKGARDLAELCVWPLEHRLEALPGVTEVPGHDLTAEQMHAVRESVGRADLGPRYCYFVLPEVDSPEVSAHLFNDLAHMPKVRTTGLLIDFQQMAEETAALLDGPLISYRLSECDE
ncbi:hypothetical protein [Celeribacter halophilus]|uniref:hypothetical protein n=1 Tax=Celeribacter halophilus TaxID=576117 RepID=UPI003A9202D9